MSDWQSLLHCRACSLVTRVESRSLVGLIDDYWRHIQYQDLSVRKPLILCCRAQYVGAIQADPVSELYVGYDGLVRLRKEFFDPGVRVYKFTVLSLPMYDINELL